MNQIKPSLNVKRSLLVSIFSFGLIGASFANYLADWPDDALCGWMANPSPPDHIVKEVERRGIGCDNGKAVAVSNNKSKKTSQADSEQKNASNKTGLSGKDSAIKIYDVEFSPGVLDELLNLVISKTDFDFSEYKLTKNEDSFQCHFTMTRIVYQNIKEGKEEGWNIAEGSLNILGSDVEFARNSRWRMGGLSTDPSYMRDQVNLKLTEDGHFVGKMAYFNLNTKDGEVPINPMYPILTEHKRSTPINLSNIDNSSAKLFIDVEDWAGAVMYIRRCKEI